MITRAPRGKVELWYEKGVQRLVKTMVIQCIIYLLKATTVGYTN